MSNWKNFKLKQLTELIKRGITPKYVEENGYIIINQRCIRDGIVDFSQARYTNKETSIPDEKKIKKTDILVNSTGVGTLGRAGYINKEIIDIVTVDSHVTIVRPDLQVINHKFLAYNLLWRQSEIENLSVGSSGQKELSRSLLENIDILLPDIESKEESLQEQEEIVNILDDAAEMVRLRQECIDHSEEITPAIFYEMFGDLIINEKDFDLYKVKQLGNVITGTTPSSKLSNMFGGKIPFITPGDLETNTYKYSRYLTEEGAKKSRLVRAGSTMVCCIGATIGKVDKAIVESAFNQQINAVEWDKKLVDDEFALHLFRQIAPLIKAKASSTTLPILNKGNFEQLNIPIPSLEQQRKFAEIAREIEEYKIQQYQELKYAERLFQSLLQKAFTGELTAKVYGVK